MPLASTPRARVRALFAVFLAALATALLVGVGLAAAPADPLGAEPDYSAYQQVLDSAVVVVSAPNAPTETRVDYHALRASPSGIQRLAEAQKQLFAVTPSRMSDAARKAWAINAYNFLVLKTVVEHLFESTDRRGSATSGNRVYWGIRIATVQTIHLPDGSFFDGTVIQVEGVPYSLNRFERHFLFKDFDPASGTKPPAGLDPRAHFAIVCASKGCPPLMPKAYRAEKLDEQLDLAVKNAFALPSHLRFDDAGRLFASAILDWYKADFGGPDAAYAFLKKYAPADKKAELAKKAFINAYILWDWSLNHTDSKTAETPPGKGRG